MRVVSKVRSDALSKVRPARRFAVRGWRRRRDAHVQKRPLLLFPTAARVRHARNVSEVAAVHTGQRRDRTWSRKNFTPDPTVASAE